jgi:hypothetical protein
MKEKKKSYPNPRFSSIEEEEKYWAAHSPLAEGYPIEIQKEKQKRSSFLTIRLTGDELTRLRDLASSKGIGPSTYIRALIKDQLTPRESAELSLREEAQLFKSILQGLAADNKAVGMTAVKDKAKGQYGPLKDAYCILQLSKVAFSQEKIHNLVTAINQEICNQLLTNACVKVITPNDTEFDPIKRITEV